MNVENDQIFKLEDYRPSEFHIKQTDLCFVLDPRRSLVRSDLHIETRNGSGASEPLILNGEELQLQSIRIDGQPLGEDDYQLGADSLTISRLPDAARFTLSIEVLVDPTGNSALSGLYLSGGNYCTQCEAEGFRRITYFLDRPDILSIYNVRIEADRTTSPVLLSNGNLIESGELDGGRHFASFNDPHPKPSYLFALVAGNLGQIRDEFITMSGRKVDLGIYVEHGKEPRAAYAMDALKRSMLWDEEKFGREYDLDVFNIVAVSDFNLGAMENKGLNLFNDKFVLADEKTATDADYASIEAIIAHEYFHNWTGNRITCRDWFQLCLKEGLTVFRDHEFSADQRSRPVKRIAEVRLLKAQQFPEDQGPLAHPVRPRAYREINNFYTATVYEKGSEVVRMIRTLIGADDFRRGMDLYFERHDGDAATIEDFLKVFEDASGRDLSQFSLWYDQAGTPTVEVSAHYDETAGSLTLELEQHIAPTPSEAIKLPMHIPLKFGLVGRDGSDMDVHGENEAVEGDVIHLRDRRQKVQFRNLKERPVLSLNRGFSAPIVLSLPQSDEERFFLARHDSDLYSRFDALSSLLLDELIAATKAIGSGDAPRMPESLLQLVGEIAAQSDLEPAYRAQAISLPIETDIARQIGTNIDPDAILAARNQLQTAITGANQQGFASLYGELADAGAPFSPDAASAGRRSLRNVLLDYLALSDGGVDRALVQYYGSSNMTDRLAALATLAHRQSNSSQAMEALSDFETRYADEPLVMDKWFQVQATIPGAASVATIARLMQHANFSLDNPNRVRALLGAFAAANQTAFHAQDGSGYQLFSKSVLEIDRRNPQLAARIATSFRSWRSLESVRQEKAREALSLIRASEALSTDLRDIVGRILGD